MTDKPLLILIAGHPTADRLLVHCDAVLRLPGASAGADQDIATARRRGLPVFHDISEIPRRTEAPLSTATSRDASQEAV